MVSSGRGGSGNVLIDILASITVFMLQRSSADSSLSQF